MSVRCSFSLSLLKRVITDHDYYSPLKAAWDPHVNYPHSCFNVTLFVTISGLINTVTDIACTLLPIFVVLRLRMPPRRRLAAAGVFVIGILANVASCLRIYFAFYAYETGGVWNQFQAAIAGNSELGLGVVS